MEKIKEITFWIYVREEPKILHSKLIKFLESNGFYRVELNSNNQIIVREKDNILSITSQAQIINFIRYYLELKERQDVLEVFARGLGSYISVKKMELLKKINQIDDRDEIDSSYMFFKNKYGKITKDKIEFKKYELLPFKIWKNRIIDKEFNMPLNDSPGQFEIFCINITKSKNRLSCLMSIIGYLMHRNKDNGETFAIIFYDENMGIDNNAHGGTGKTLISQAISKCREVELFNGKEIKKGSWFQHQRVNITTDLLVYDDLNKDIGLENFFPMLTTGVEVEKKRQQSFFIEFEKAPKVLITSNYIVKGPGGPSDERRRYEFELLNHYNVNNTPEKEFGNRFFGKQWDNKEWNKFYDFMMRCIQEYFSFGLQKAKSINLEKSKKNDTSCKEFIEFAELIIDLDEWSDKREFDLFFKEEFPEYIDLSSKKITKWLKAYSDYIGGNFETKSTGGNYYFKISKS